MTGNRPTEIRGRSKRHGAGSTDQLLEAIVAGHKMTAAARQAGMSESTARRRLREPEVAEQLADLRREVVTTVSDRLASLALGAVVVLGQMCNDGTLAPNPRIRAAEAILDKWQPFRQAGDDARLLAEIRAALDAERRFQGAVRSVR